MTSPLIATPLVLVIGLVGMSCILLGFFMNDFMRKWGHNTIKYNLLNIIGAGLLVYYSGAISSIPFLILNVVWFLVAGYKIWKLMA